MNKLIVVFISTLLLTACVKPAPEVTLNASKDYVLERLNANPTACEYRGRAELILVNSYEKVSSSTLLNKQCNGNIDVKFLGPFGMVMAEASIANGIHKVFKGGKEITDTVYFPLSKSELKILSSYLSAPPILLDKSFRMYVHNNKYNFVKQGVRVEVSEDFFIHSIITDYYIIKYSWEDNFIKTIDIMVENNLVTAKFYSGWIAK